LCGFAAVLVLVVGATPAQAQFFVEPYGGVYIPTMDLIDQDFLGETIKGSQKTSFALGGRLGFGFGAFGVEGNVLYALSKTEATIDGTPVPDEDAAVWTVDGRLAWKILPVGPVGIHLTGGVALVNFTGDAYEDIGGTSNLGGVLGGGVTFKLPGMLSIRGDLDGFFYQAKFEQGGQETDSAWQVDVVASAGLVITFGVM
jgi:hypothetical protein